MWQQRHQWYSELLVHETFCLLPGEKHQVISHKARVLIGLSIFRKDSFLPSCKPAELTISTTQEHTHI